MDAAHEAELARILANRKKGNRLLGGASGSGGGSAPIPAPSQTPETTTQTQTQAIPNRHSPTAPTSATRQVSDTIGSGAIVIEAERNNTNNQQQQQQQQQQQGSPRKYITTDVTSSTVVTRPSSGGGNINNNNSSSPEVAELERIRRQGEDQARQIQQLQRSLDSLINLQQSGGGAGGTTMMPMNSLGAQTQRGNSFLSSSNNNRDMINDNNHSQQQQQQYFSSNQQQQRALPSSSPSRTQNTFNNNTSNNSNVENTFQKASAMGIFVKPHRVLGENGKGYITFQSASRNTRGLSAGRSNNRSVRASSPGHNQSRSSPRSVAFGGDGGAAAEDFQGNYDAVDQQQQQQNRTGLVHSPNSTQHRNTTANTSKPLRLSKRGGGGGDERIPKPFSTSTVDIDSAVVLLTTGDWFYKLRVQVQNASIVGPAGWKIESSDRRYVYLDTTTYILKWGDRPGGSATLFSHYVPINEIVSIQIYAQSEPNFSGSAPRTVYYIVMHVVEGGFNARGRAVNKRLCVIATELRDKADMWIDALQTIRSFYRSKGIAAQLHGNTYSSD